MNGIDAGCGYNFYHFIELRDIASVQMANDFSHLLDGNKKYANKLVCALRMMYGAIMTNGYRIHNITSSAKKKKNHRIQIKFTNDGIAFGFRSFLGKFVFGIDDVKVKLSFHYFNISFVDCWNLRDFAPETFDESLLMTRDFQALASMNKNRFPLAI